MLLTYTDNASIPAKLSLFYSQAYESLYLKHDALKGGFIRERKSGLDIRDFQRVFSAFSVVAYDSHKFAFSELEALDALGAAKQLTPVEYDSAHVLDDAMNAACLLVEDGNRVTFSHRSFQEFFVAQYIAHAPPHLQEKLIKRFARRVGHDSVVDLLFELDPFSVEKYFVLPALRDLRRKIGAKNKVGTTAHLNYLRGLYTDFFFNTDDESPGLLV